jgi:hypothetical protein
VKTSSRRTASVLDLGKLSVRHVSNPNRSSIRLDNRRSLLGLKGAERRPLSAERASLAAKGRQAEIEATPIGDVTELLGAEGTVSGHPG